MCNINRTKAYARIKGGNLYPNLTGIIFFDELEEATEVHIEVWGLPDYVPATKDKEPIGPHGFHIHENGLCQLTNPDNPFESAGGHYNPSDQPHGNHAGDFPVLFSNDGYARVTFFTDKFRPEDIIGKSVIIHENPDDYRSQPAGNSGKRIACGVIEEAII